MKIFIVGAASGIGFKLAESLFKRGHNVFIGVHKEEQITSVEAKIKEKNLNISVYKLDVRKKIDRKKILKINPDCLVIHDGIGNGGSILEMDIGVLKDNYETNVFANFSLLKEFYELKKQKCEKGKVFITSSMAAYMPIPFLGCYTSTKASISMICKTLKYELKYLNDSISITLVEPGAYHTGFNQVMIDNKILFTYKDSKICRNEENINRLQRNLFRLFEKDDCNDLVKKIIREMEKEKPRFRIRKPVLQGVFLRLYLIFFC